MRDTGGAEGEKEMASTPVQLFWLEIPYWEGFYALQHICLFFFFLAALHLCMLSYCSSIQFIMQFVFSWEFRVASLP